MSELSERARAVAPRVLLIHNLLALLAVSLLTALLVFLRGALSTPVIALLYLLPVLVSATQWGLGAGITASVCAFLAFNYFFIEPFYTLRVHQSQDIIVLGVFLIVATVGSQFVGRLQSSLAEIRAREWEVARLYDLSGTLAGARDEENIARLLAERIHRTFAAEWLRIRVQAGESRQIELVVPSGASLPNDAPGARTPLAAGGRVTGQIEIWRARPFDRTEDRMLRSFAEQGTLALERAILAQAETRARILEESDKLKSALLSSVSHELRTPLVTIKAAVSSLRSREIDWSSEARVELLAALEEETDRLNQLVANLLNMSRLESGAIKLERQWNVLAEIIDATLNHMGRATEQHRLEVDAPDDLPLAPVDTVLMQQVFANLISNGLKYAPAGSTIRIEVGQQGDEALLVQVINEGPHVPEEHLERIFDRFHRVTRAERVGGIGLGLSICKGIVEAHGGRIWAENLPGGFAFKFTLPLAWDGGPRRPPSGNLEQT